jgi:hypothetical protein
MESVILGMSLTTRLASGSTPVVEGPGSPVPLVSSLKATESAAARERDGAEAPSLCTSGPFTPGLHTFMWRPFGIRPSFCSSSDDRTQLILILLSAVSSAETPMTMLDGPAMMV